MTMFNVYRWRRSFPLARAERVAQVEADHAPGAMLAARASDPTLETWLLFARRADRDEYAGVSQ